MKVINLYGGPGSGKSTTAAYVFSKLKLDGLNVELVREYAKDIVYEQRLNLFKHQLYITAKQYKRLKDIQDYGKVPLVITDSPLRLGFYYGQELDYADAFSEVVENLYGEFDNIDVFITRVKEFESSGRLQILEEAQKVDKFFSQYDYNFTIDGNKDGAERLYEYIKGIL